MKAPFQIGNRLVWFYLMLIGCCPETVFGQTVFQQNGAASLIVHNPLNDNRIDLQLADLLKITLRVEGPRGLEVAIPEKATQSPGWGVREVAPAGTFDLDDQRQRWEQTFTFEPLAPQIIPLQIEPLRVRLPGAKQIGYSWKPLPVRVTASITDPGLEELRDPVTLELPPPPEPSLKYLPWVALAILILAALFLGINSWTKRRPSSPALPPERWTLRELDKLMALDIPETGRGGRFHTLLANILRRYLEKKYHLPARRRTTPEFLQAMPSSTLDPSQQAFLRDFFERCDLAKFATAPATADECRTLAGQAQDFVQGKMFMASCKKSGH